MVAADLILAAMLSLPPSALDASDTEEEREALFRPVAEAIAEVAKNDRQAALLIAQGWEDSKFSRRVLEYRCHEMPAGQRCDAGKSVGAFQVSARWCRPASVVDEARCALKAAGGGMTRCKDHSISPIAGAFVGLGGMGRPCNWTKAEERAATYKRVLQRLRAAGEVAKR